MCLNIMHEYRDMFVIDIALIGQRDISRMQMEFR